MATVRGYETLPRNNLDAVMNHLANEGPLSVAGKTKMNYCAGASIKRGRFWQNRRRHRAAAEAIDAPAVHYHTLGF